MPTQRIFFKRLALDARIGILEHELRQTQPLHIDAEIDILETQAIDDNDINSVLDYRKIRQIILEEATRKHIHLVEALGEMISVRLLAEFAEITRVQLRISKPQAFSDCEGVGIEYVGTR